MAASPRLAFPVTRLRLAHVIVPEDVLTAPPAPRLPPDPFPCQCATCWGQRRIWEPGPLGLLPVICPDCDGFGIA